MQLFDHPPESIFKIQALIVCITCITASAGSLVWPSSGVVAQLVLTAAVAVASFWGEAARRSADVSRGLFELRSRLDLVSVGGKRNQSIH